MFDKRFEETVLGESVGRNIEMLRIFYTQLHIRKNFKNERYMWVADIKVL